MEASSTGGQGSPRAVAPTDNEEDDDDDDDDWTQDLKHLRFAFIVYLSYREGRNM